MYFTTVHQSVVMFLKENERFTGREMRRIGVSWSQVRVEEAGSLQAERGMKQSQTWN